MERRHKKPDCYVNEQRIYISAAVHTQRPHRPENQGGLLNSSSCFAISNVEMIPSVFHTTTQADLGLCLPGLQVRPEVSDKTCGGGNKFICVRLGMQATLTYRKSNAIRGKFVV